MRYRMTFKPKLYKGDSSWKNFFKTKKIKDIAAKKYWEAYFLCGGKIRSIFFTCKLREDRDIHLFHLYMRDEIQPDRSIKYNKRGIPTPLAKRKARIT